MLYCLASSEGIQPKVELSRFIPYIVDQNTEEGKIAGEDGDHGRAVSVHRQ
jgi:hypothetical protein